MDVPGILAIDSHRLMHASSAPDIAHDSRDAMHRLDKEFRECPRPRRNAYRNWTGHRLGGKFPGVLFTPTDRLRQSSVARKRTTKAAWVDRAELPAGLGLRMRPPAMPRGSATGRCPPSCFCPRRLLTMRRGLRRHGRSARDRCAPGPTRGSAPHGWASIGQSSIIAACEPRSCSSLLLPLQPPLQSFRR